MREERIEERGGERRGDRISPDLSFLISVASLGVIILAMYVSRVRIRVRGSYQV